MRRSRRAARTCSKLEWPNTLADVAAAAERVRAAGSVAVVGFCWGGTVAHVAASELDFDAAVSYYGGGVAKMLDKRPRCPILYHFGDQDHAIPLADIDKIKAAYPDATCTSTRARATASTAMSEAVTVRPTRGSRSAARWNSCASVASERPHCRLQLSLT